MSRYIFTSESVTEGHPDKVCDAISDAVLDACLAQDPASRVACECCATTDRLLVMGEITTRAQVDIEAIARRKIADIGYTRPDEGFDAASCRIDIALDKQSPDIARGVDSAADDAMGEGAGDQGLMFGYACDETPALMPLAAYLAHKLTRRLAQARRSGELAWLRPDGKAQVSVEYDGDRPVRVEAVVVSTQHSEDIGIDRLRSEVRSSIINAVIPAELMDENTKFHINPTGRFVVGGPSGDSGLTGRKIIVDTYGGYARHGGGAFSGKDPSKVDRSAAYMARYIAKNVVAAGLARRCELQIAYAIGVARPVSVSVSTFGTGTVSDEAILAAIGRIFDMRPAAIIDTLGLCAPIYSATTNYGHFGREDCGFAWERTDRAAELAELARSYK